ncbi:MAG: 2'-5' RNA ligase family protein [Patescibacteria group bacterium]
MRYFVAHLLSGDAKNYHENLTRELASKYRIIPLHERMPPHLTIKPPFETDDAGIAEVERTLRAFLHHERAVALTIQGFGRFGFRTIYMDVHKSTEAVSFVRRAIEVLNTHIPWMPAYPLEGNKLHASVARFLNRRQFRRIWRELRTLRPQFETLLDTIVILKKEDRVWRIHATVPLRPLNERTGSSFSTNGFERPAPLVTLHQ